MGSSIAFLLFVQIVLIALNAVFASAEIAVLTVNDLVKSDDCFFAATGISGGDFLRGVRYSARHAVTHSLVLRGKTGTLRYVESYHNMDRLSKISAVNY